MSARLPGGGSVCEGPVQEGVFEKVEEVPCSCVVVQDVWGRLPTCSLERL